jgi:hypothetical protein
LARKELEVYLWYLEHVAASGSMYQYEENLESKVIVMLWFWALEAGDSMFLQNIVKVLLDYMASHPRRWYCDM